MKAIIFLFTVLLAGSIRAAGGPTDTLSGACENMKWTNNKTFYLELGGKFFPSINLDIRRSEKSALNFGLGLWKDNEEHEQWLFIPSATWVYLFGKKRQFEAGGGMGPFISTYNGVASILIFSSIGYRYQKIKNAFFRASFSPFVGIPVGNKSRFWIIPWAGIGLGYTF